MCALFLFYSLCIFQSEPDKPNIGWKELEVKEYGLSKQIVEWINSQPYCHARKVHSGAYDGRGEPDILACVHGRMVVIETKLPKGGKPLPIQEFKLAQWRAAGAEAFWVKSLPEVQSRVTGLRPIGLG